MGSCMSLEENIQMPENKVAHAIMPAKANSAVSKSPQTSVSGERTNNVVIVSKNVNELRRKSGSGDIDIFTYDEMKLATKNFRPDKVLGEGGFGIVYKGVIDGNVRPGYKSTLVAVKELDPEGLQGDREWLAEVNYLGQLRHPNLVRLIGYCCEDDHRLLVYEYMSSGSLEKHLFPRVGATPTWSTRMKIALHVAKGLDFLHNAERQIIYRDFKTGNILLDENFNAKISDFGLAKEGPMGDQTHVSTRVMGTYGYAAPEYVMTGHLTSRSDIYGFGVVLLEMLIGRRAMDKSRPSREHNLVEWARPLLTHRKLLRILDPRMDGQYSSRIAMKVANLTYQCLSQNPKGRPFISQVVEILETVQTRGGLEEEAMLQSGSGSVTLYEVPKRVAETPPKSEPGSLRCESEGEAKPQRSKSETPMEFDLYSSSPSVITDERC